MPEVENSPVSMFQKFFPRSSVSTPARIRLALSVPAVIKSATMPPSNVAPSVNGPL